jgi:hypothetical protein
VDFVDVAVEVDVEDADPSRVTLQLDLLPSENVEPYLYTESRIAEYVEFQSAKATKSGGMVLRSLGATDFGIAGILRLTNGNTQITVTNGAEVAGVYSYTVWHTSTVTTNEWVDEYGVTNISTNTLWTPVSPPFNGIDSEWECLTTNLVLSGGVGVYEDANSSSNARVRFYAVANRLDSDGDGLSDGAEIFIHRTDPDDPDSDGDGVSDGVDIALGSNPLDMASYPVMTALDEALGMVNVAQLGYLGYLAGVTFSCDSSTNYAQRIQQLRDMLEGLAGSFLDLDVNTGGVLAERPDVATWSLGTVLASTGNSSGQWLGGLASTAQVEEIGAVLGKLSRLVNEGSRQSGHAHQPIALHTGVVQVGSAWNLGTGYPERWPTNQPIQTYLLLDTKVDIPYVGPGTVDDWIDVNGSARFPNAGYIFTNHVADISPVWESEGTNTLELWDCGDCAGENNYAYLSPFTLVQVLEVPILKVDINGFSLSPTWARGNGCAEAPHQSTCQATIQPSGVSALTYSIQGATHGATIDANTGVVTPGVNNSGTVTVRVAASAYPSVYAETNLVIRAIPTSWQSCSVNSWSPPGAYGGQWTHTFSSSGGSLNGVDISETVLTRSGNPFGYSVNITPGPPNVWTLDANGTMNAPDSYFTGSIYFDATAFLPSPPKGGLPQTGTDDQWYHWWCPLDNKWILFTGPYAIDVTLLYVGTNLIVRTAAYGQNVDDSYTGPSP